MQLETWAMYCIGRECDLFECRYVASGPLVRSSYKAGEFFVEAMLDADERSKSRA